MKSQRIWSRAQGAWQRRAAKWFGRRIHVMSPGCPIISFTFDDFPTSALEVAGPLLRAAGTSATYYTSFGLAGQDTATGRIFDLSALQAVLDLGHELGCHTYQHCPAWATKPSDYAFQVDRNARALESHLPGQVFHTHSYPVSYPRPQTKRKLSRRFACCRGGGQTFNSGSIDLNYLKGYFIEQSRDYPGAVKAVIDENARAGGWLIFATHDVCRQPTRFGCTPDLFEEIVTHSARSGARLLSMSEAIQAIGATAKCHSPHIITES